MNSLLDDNDDLDRDDRELTLSTTAILGIFFGLVLLCGLFFGFGYKVGSHKAAIAAPVVEAAPASTTDFSSFKSAGASTGSTKPTAGTSTSTAPSAPVTSPPPVPSAQPAAPVTAPPPVAPHAAVAVAHPPAATTVATPPAVTTPAPTPVSLGTGFVVQIAAISITHQGDADLLVSALKSKGYAVSAHSEPDRFIHVQVGPFANRKDAEAMRNRLSADGYQPFIK